jgi:tRNA (guanine-N7-)-methyltransferase
MGRRALRKIEPTLDLTDHLCTLDELPQPFHVVPHFGRDVPLEVEVGSGKGLFIQNAAQANPQRCYLGIEVMRKYARFCAARLAQNDSQNAFMVQGDGLRLFHEYLDDQTVSAVHVYFPDPWWKKRHKKRRVMNEQLLADVQRVLIPGGQLHFWTDVAEYYETSLELIAHETLLIGPLPVPERPATDDLDYRTHFERRTRLHAQAVYRAEFRSPEASRVSLETRID